MRWRSSASGRARVEPVGALDANPLPRRRPIFPRHQQVNRGVPWCVTKPVELHGGHAGDLGILARVEAGRDHLLLTGESAGERSDDVRPDRSPVPTLQFPSDVTLRQADLAQLLPRGDLLPAKESLASASTPTVLGAFAIAFYVHSRSRGRAGGQPSMIMGRLVMRDGRAANPKVRAAPSRPKIGS